MGTDDWLRVCLMEHMAEAGISSRERRPLLPGARRRHRDAVAAMLARDSVAARRLAAPITFNLHRVRDVWRDLTVTP
jgi:hypothetical protein